LSSTVTANITITAVNQPPTFNSTSYEFACSEDVQAPFLLGSVRATDPDFGSNGDLLYSISSATTVPFSIDPTLGAVSVSGALDREQQPAYTVSVVCSDKGSPPRTATAALVVRISDVNDNAPMFAFPTLSVSLSEDTSITSLVASMLASDADFGSNAAVSYSIQSGNDEGKFKIDTLSGKILTRYFLLYVVLT
jgi:hypothetical protein